MPGSLEDKVALVTDGSGAIGRAICVELGRRGARVIFTYSSDRPEAEITEAALEEIGSSVEMIKCDLADVRSIRGLVASLRGQIQSLDMLVANTSTVAFQPATELSEKRWQECMDTSANALLRLAQELVGKDAPLLVDGGRIVALSSLGAERAIPQFGAVGAAQAALQALARHLACELGPREITVNVVSPGLLEPLALEDFPNREQLVEEARRKTPLGRLTTPEDVAHVVAFLCSEQADMISGQTIHVDGGYSIVA